MDTNYQQLQDHLNMANGAIWNLSNVSIYIVVYTSIDWSRRVTLYRVIEDNSMGQSDNDWLLRLTPQIHRK